MGLLDDGSDSTFILTDAAVKFYGLKGKDEAVHLETAGNAPEHKILPRFSFRISRIDGTAQPISCLGLDSITGNNSEDVDISAAYSLFPHIPKGALERPRGRVEILIGQDYASLLTFGGLEEDVVGQLRAMRAPLGTGWVLGGRHPQIKGQQLTLSSDVNLL